MVRTSARLDLRGALALDSAHRPGGEAADLCRHRGAHAWLIDPDLRTLEAFENLDGRWLLLGVHENDNPMRLPPFDAISSPLNALWAD